MMLERDHPLAARHVAPPILPNPRWKNPALATNCSPMDGIDEYFVAIVDANPTLRVRVENPDELRSNRMGHTLNLLKYEAAFLRDPVRSFPSNLTAMVFGFKTKPNFAAENEKEIAKPPKVDFSPAPAKPQGEAQGSAK